MDKKTKAELFDIIDKIARSSEQFRRLRLEVSRVRERLHVIRAQHIIDVALAEDEKGKRVYSNDVLREAALTLRLNKDEEYQSLRQKLWELEEKEDTSVVEYTRLVHLKDALMAELGAGKPPEIPPDIYGRFLPPRG